MTVTSVGQALSAYGAALKRAEAGNRRRRRCRRRASPAWSRPAWSRPAADLRAGEAKAVEALTGQASLQDVVEAVTEAELSLQKMTAVRDRVISAYQEIMRMPI